MAETTKKLTPSEYFTNIKAQRNTVTDESLNKYYDSVLLMFKKCSDTGQKEAVNKLIFLTDVIKKEHELVKLGINQFIYRDKIQEFIAGVEKKVVKVIKLEDYERAIPDEIVEAIVKTKDIFDGFYVVFTDYTGAEGRKVEQKKRDRDPILFGVFTKGEMVCDRFYVVGDWIDEYCDLTLDKMLDEYSKKHDGENISHEIIEPQTRDELARLMAAYTKNNDKKEHSHDDYRVMVDYDLPMKEKHKSFFDKVRSLVKK